MLELNVWHADTANVAPGDRLLDVVVEALAEHGSGGALRRGPGRGGRVLAQGADVSPAAGGRARPAGRRRRARPGARRPRGDTGSRPHGEELAAVDALVLPGGESTTMIKLLRAFDLLDPLRSRIGDGLPRSGPAPG
jgi:5'-phosphate synthase pdxT subunit